MSNAEELLDSVYNTSVTATLSDSSVEGHIIIANDRRMTVPVELKRLAVQYDHNIETVTFDCPRYWDEHDMSTMNVYVNYLRTDGEIGVFKAENVSVDADDSSIMHFDWTVSRNVTEASGKLAFLVCVKNTDADGNEVNHWNSEICKDCYVSEGLEMDAEEFKDLYADVIEQWYRDVTSAIQNIETVKDNIIEMRDSGDFDGATFTPSVNDDCDLSWTNDRGRPNPATVNIKGNPGVSPTIQVSNIQGGHRVTINDVNGSKYFDVLDTIVEGTEAVNALIDTLFYIGDIEPSTVRTLWFDTSEFDAITSDYENGDGVKY